MNTLAFKCQDRTNSYAMAKGLVKIQTMEVRQWRSIGLGSDHQAPTKCAQFMQRDNKGSGAGQVMDIFLHCRCMIAQV